MANEKIHSYRDLIVWQKSMDLVVAAYDLTDQYPNIEIYGLTSQTRRSAISIPSNIAEGRRRFSRKDFRYRLIIAYSSGAELETQIDIARRLPFSNNLNFKLVDSLLEEVMKMLNSMISGLGT